MPFKSEAQRRMMWAKHPRIARRWADETGPHPGLPMHVKEAMSDELSKIAEVAAVEAARERAVTSVTKLHDKLLPGDILFSEPDMSRESVPWRAFKLLSRKAQGTNYGHNAIYAGHGKIIESRLGERVSEKPLTEMTSSNNVLVMRPDVTAAERHAAVEYARTEIGKPYNVAALARSVLPGMRSGFDRKREDLHSMICSALVANAYYRRKFSDKARSLTLPGEMMESGALKPVTILERFNNRRGE